MLFLRRLHNSIFWLLANYRVSQIFFHTKANISDPVKRAAVVSVTKDLYLLLKNDACTIIMPKCNRIINTVHLVDD